MESMKKWGLILQLVQSQSENWKREAGRPIQKRCVFEELLDTAHRGSEDSKDARSRNPHFFLLSSQQLNHQTGDLVVNDHHK